MSGWGTLLALPVIPVSLSSTIASAWPSPSGSRARIPTTLSTSVIWVYHHERLGDLARAAGDTGVAEQHYRVGLAIAERLAAADPDNAEYQRDLGISHARLGVWVPDTPSRL